MDWNKTKTIFIVVFSILNVFLYSLYVKQRTDALNVQVVGKTSIEEVMKQENITYNLSQETKNDFYYVSANIKMFTKEELESLKSQSIVISDNTRITSEMSTPVSILNAKGDYHFTEFLTKYVLNGMDYEQWEVNKEEKKAIFFQKVNGEPIFYSPNAMLTVHWDDNYDVTHYEQRMLKEFISYNRKKDLLTQNEAVGSLATRGYLKQDSKVLSVTAGYSTLMQLTETQVFAPTWNIRVELKDGKIEDHFINAIEGKVIEFKLDKTEVDNPTEVEEE
ncbi:two-component system regulatory protein YycI [Sporosarcina highlanderae]|uniref:Two-component system regulatory protein YycI n=1 Tax=Sporosarcina highlanderae TaxID=3035916 RepID=A0ABT8JUS3_9BACL|nr:two-component system regulatory protein YycI [Sporosarcina highlanderae]MDN4608920.1 two-component system regulatory protein YycI [Sporosarcina highlanderae]